MPLISTVMKPTDGRCSDVMMEDLLRQFSSRLDALRKLDGGELRLEFITKMKQCLDSTIEILVWSEQKSHPIGVITCSRPEAPDIVARGVRSAEQIRSIVGEELGEAIIRPICTGRLDGQSYAILPWYRPVATSRLRWAWQRRWLRKPILEWLHQTNVVAAENDTMSDEAIDICCDVLEHLLQQDFVRSEQKKAIKSSLQRIEKKQWHPRMTIDHNDLWQGNVLIRDNGILASNSTPFVLIDWAGANPFGHGVYDLMRIARALGLSVPALQKELVRHAEALQCDVEDTRGHLLAALGRLHMHREHFPEACFINVFHNCWHEMNNALGNPSG